MIALSEVERRQQYLDNMIGEAEVLRPLVEECLDYDPAVRPTIATVCGRIRVSNDAYMKECPQESIFVHQENQKLRIENAQQKAKIDQLNMTVEQHRATIEQMVMRANYKYYLTWYYFLVLHKEYTDTTSSQST